MITREINNIGQPLRGPSGTPLGGIKIEFMLANIRGIPADAIDTTSHEWYLPVPVCVVTSPADTDTLKIGEFQVDLWPTSRGDQQVFYRCTVKGVGGARTFVAPLVESVDPLEWDAFSTSGAELEPAEISPFALHVQDNVRHLSIASSRILCGLDDGTTLPGAVLQAQIDDLIAHGVNANAIIWYSTGSE